MSPQVSPQLSPQLSPRAADSVTSALALSLRRPLPFHDGPCGRRYPAENSV